MIAPLPLVPGDKIGLIAPSRKVNNLDLENFVNLLEEWGYQAVTGDNLYGNHHQYSGKDEERAEDFLKMIHNPEIKAIMCVRGGYGTVRILEKLNKQALRKNPKWIIGYSDITVLHSFYNKVIECETIHATMPVHFTPEKKNDESWIRLRDMLRGEMTTYAFDATDLNREGKVTGMLVGGNLSVLFSLRGTMSDLDTDGKILFIEDLDEYLYHIDRMMMNLKISGKLKKLKGLIVGGMTQMKDNNIPFGKDAYQIIADAVNDYNYPVAFGFPAGHCEPNLPMILGRTVILNCNQEIVKLDFTERS